MNNLRKKLTALIITAFVVSFSVSAQAASLTDVSDAMSSHNPSQAGVTHTIKFKPNTNISAPGDIKITWAAGFDLSAVVASSDITVSGGNVTWTAPVNGDLVSASRVLTLHWATGTLTSGNQVTVTVNFVKNPSSGGNYNLTIATGASGFSTATDNRVIPLVIVATGVAVSAQVPFPATNPAITNILPAEPILIDTSLSSTEIITFDLKDVNNDNIDYTVTPSGGNHISVSPSPVSPVTGTATTKTVTFTYFADGTPGNQTITVTADDNEGTGGGLVTYTIQLLII